MLRLRITVIAVVLIVGCSRPPAPPVADIEAGKKVAAAACVECHGLNGKSAGPEIPHLAAQYQGYLEHALRAYRQKTRGSEGMQTAVGALSNADMVNVAAHYAGLPPLKPTGAPPTGSPKPIVARPTMDVAAGKAAAAVCAGCHGADGNSAIPGTPSMAGQDAPYLAVALRAYQDGSRRHALMQGAAATLSERDIANLAAFYAAQAPRPPKARVPLPPEAWAEKCDRCHEPGIENPVFVFPRIKGQPAGYIAKELKAYKEEESKLRTSAMMHAMMDPLMEKEIAALAEYYARQPPR